MADADTRSIPSLVGKSETSYKDKLMQQAGGGDISGTDQNVKPRLQPSKDAGSPPMTITTDAQAGEATMPETATGVGASVTPTYSSATDIKTTGGKNTKITETRDRGNEESERVASPRGYLWSPSKSTQSAIDARFHFIGRQHSITKDDYKAPEGAAYVPQPEHVDDYPSDTEEQKTKTSENISTKKEGWERSANGGDNAATAGAPPATGPDATKPAEAGVAASYGPLQQAPAVKGDSAAEPAAAAGLPSEDTNIGSSTSTDKSAVAAAGAEGQARDDSSSGGGVGGSSKDQNPIASAAAAVAKPVAAAVGQLKDVLMGSSKGEENNEGLEGDLVEKSEGSGLSGLIFEEKTEEEFLDEQTKEPFAVL